uniref:Uncharacterized protein n=1 Tax=viral metagenome TaxID=1070528 RepID=A0A6M3X7T2_9ZZZZ
MTMKSGNKSDLVFWVKWMLKIESVEQLKTEAKDADDFFILLKFGLKSSKRIWWNGKRFLILNQIDNSEQHLTEKELYTESNIGIAIDKGAFFKD